MKTQIPYAPIGDAEEEALRLELSRLRSGIFDCGEEELARRHVRIAEIKAICACSWDSRAAQFAGDRLTSMGY